MGEVNELKRRDFVGNVSKASLVFGLPVIVPDTALGLSGSAPASEKINLGVIGLGRRCKYILAEVLKNREINCRVIVDVQASHREEGKKIVDTAYGNSLCETMQDFRELLARKDIDAVLIATGDRWHATASMMAAEAGKDIYCEKPCGLTIDFCQRLDATILRTGRIFQAGTQRRTVVNYEQAVKIAREGKLGRLKRLVASAYTPNVDNNWFPAEPTPNREVVDWNMWLGPAPWRPYNKKYVEGSWRGQWDFDSGARLLDWCAHTVDLCQMANQSDDTLPVEYVTVENGIECKYANGVVIFIEFLKDPFGEKPGWMPGIGTCPVRYIGEHGWVETGDGGDIYLSIDGKANKIEKTGERLRGHDVVNHIQNFVDSVKSRKPTACNSTVMRRSHIASHSAALAWMLKRPLKIDPATETFINDDEANRLKYRSERTNWI